MHYTTHSAMNMCSSVIFIGFCCLQDMEIVDFGAGLVGLSIKCNN